MKKGFLVVLAIIMVSGLILGGCAEPAPTPAPAPTTPTPAPAPEDKWEPPIPGMKQGEEDLYFEWRWSMPGNPERMLSYEKGIEEMWCDAMEERTGGRFKVTIHPGGTLAKHPEADQMVAAGVVEMAHTSQSFHPEDNPYSIDHQPFYVFPYPDYDKTQKLLDYTIMHPLPTAANEKQNLMVAVNFINMQPYIIMMRKGAPKIEKFEDFEGLLIRSFGTWSIFAENLGGTPVSIGTPDAYEGLQKGMIDITLQSLGQLKNFSLGEVCDRGIKNTYLCPSGGHTVMNRELFLALPQYIQDIFMETREEFQQLHVKLRLEDELAFDDYLDEIGFTAYDLPAAEMAKVEAAAGPIYMTFIERGLEFPTGQHMVQYVQDCVDFRDTLTPGEHWDLADEAIAKYK